MDGGERNFADSRALFITYRLYTGKVGRNIHARTKTKQIQIAIGSVNGNKKNKTRTRGVYLRCRTKRV